MAFSNMAGFDVTPHNPSSAIRRCKAPLATKLRPISSSQTDCPNARRARTGFTVLACETFIKSPPLYVFGFSLKVRDGIRAKREPHGMVSHTDLSPTRPGCYQLFPDRGH